MTTDIYKFKDPLSYAQISLDELKNGSQGIWLDPPGKPVTRLRNPPSFHDSSNYAYKILPTLMQKVPITYPPVFTLAINQVILAGYRALLHSKGTFCLDESYLDEASCRQALDRLSALDSFNNEETGLVRIANDFSFRFELGKRKVIDGIPLAIVLCSTEPSNYGSFLFRILPKLQTMRKLGIQAPIIAPVFTTSMEEYFKLCGIDSNQIIRHDPNIVYQFNRAILISLRNNQAYLDDGSLALYTQLREKYGLSSSGRKLYITRHNSGINSYAASHRVMMNEPELIGALKAYGFEIIEPSQLNAIEQIKLFSSAGLILGASGSAMFNSVFCHPGTKLIDIESEPHWIHAHMCLFGSLGLKYGIFEATPSNLDFSIAHKPYNVNIVALMKRISQFDRS